MALTGTDEPRQGLGNGVEVAEGAGGGFRGHLSPPQLSSKRSVYISVIALPKQCPGPLLVHHELNPILKRLERRFLVMDLGWLPVWSLYLVNVIKDRREASGPPLTSLVLGLEGESLLRHSSS